MGWVRLVLVLGLLVGLPAARASGQEQSPPGGANPAAAPRLDGSPPPAAPAADDSPGWVATVRAAELWSDSDGGTSFGQVPQWSYFQLTGRDANGRIYVLNPRTENYAWIEADAVGPVPAPTDDSYLRDPDPAPAATADTPPDTASAPDASTAQWVANFRPADLWSDSDGGTDFGVARQWSYFALTGQAENDRLYVFNPRTQNYAWIDADAVGPTGAPPDWYLRQPELLYSVQKPGRIVGGYNVRSWPSVRDDTRLRQLGHNAPVFVEEAVRGDDGEEWYRIGDEEYVNASGVKIPRNPPQYFQGRWIDVDLSEPAMVAAYEGDKLVYATLSIKGTQMDPTPTGVYHIQRRVADETMDSATLGIPRNSPRGYYLQHVLYTQYFTSNGASIHYNYWSSMWGYSGSHGCLGMTLDDALWFWNWAGVGTLLNIHY
ncbi:MAG TPA: L,D-transpeptidase family protein [Chloroflexota bacterium]|nr:L,D-transpeptidase family protein [Chloroflexota bacterium]